MKKILTVLASTAIFASIVSADVGRVEMGVGAWAQEPSGGMTHEQNGFLNGNYTSQKNSDTSAYAWLLLKHPIPILPNLRVEYTNLKDSGNVTGSFKNFSGATNAPGSLELTQFDIIPYYNILDNTAWITLDLGLDLKVQNTKYKVDGVTVGGVASSSYEDTLALVIPLLYVRTRVEIPGTDIGFEADGKYVTYDGSTIYDVRAKVDYTLSFIPVVHPAVELGYRVQKFDIKYEDGPSKTGMDLNFSGVYAGLMLRF